MQALGCLAGSQDAPAERDLKLALRAMASGILLDAILPAGAVAGVLTLAGAAGASGAAGVGVDTAAPPPLLLPPMAAFNAATFANPILVAASSGVSQVMLVPTLLTSGSAKHLRLPAHPLAMNLPFAHWANPPLMQALGCLAGSQEEPAERLLKLLFSLMASGML